MTKVRCFDFDAVAMNGGDGHQMLRTVKNLADELGVEKFRIYKFIRDNDLRVTHLGSSKIMYFDDREAAKIIRAFTPETFEPDEEDMIAINGNMLSSNSEEKADADQNPLDYENSYPQVSAEQEAFRAERMIIRSSEEFAAIIDDAYENYEFKYPDISEEDDQKPEETETVVRDTFFDEEEDYAIDDMLTFVFDGEELSDQEESEEQAFDAVFVESRSDENHIVRNMAEVIHSQDDLIKNLKEELQMRDVQIDEINVQLSNMTGALRNANECIKRLSEGTRNLTESLKASQALYMSAVHSLSEEQEEKRMLEDRLSEMSYDCEEYDEDQEYMDDKNDCESEGEVLPSKEQNISAGIAFGNLGKRFRGYLSGRRSRK